MGDRAPSYAERVASPSEQVAELFPLHRMDPGSPGAMSNQPPVPVRIQAQSLQKNNAKPQNAQYSVHWVEDFSKVAQYLREYPDKGSPRSPMSDRPSDPKTP